MSRDSPCIRGRGISSRPAGRFAVTRVDDEDGEPEPDAPGPDTALIPERIRSLITHNASPDLPFSQTINPYRGCEHGCVYCYARPAHAYMDLSPGLDFEQRIFTKPGAAAMLRRELSRPGYRCAPIALAGNTDAYQPAERRLCITRQLLEVLLEFRHPVTVVTKSSLIERDLDLLAALARGKLVLVMVSITTLDDELKRRMEPRAASPRRRLGILRTLSAAGIPCGVMAAPMIPGLNDHELEQILAESASAGAGCAGYTLLRLPHEVQVLFTAWIGNQYPRKAARVLNLIRSTRGGRLNDPRFGSRMRGEGALAALLARRFETATRRLGLSTRASQALDTTSFRVSASAGQQLPLI